MAKCKITSDRAASIHGNFQQMAVKLGELGGTHCSVQMINKTLLLGQVAPGGLYFFGWLVFVGFFGGSFLFVVTILNAKRKKNRQYIWVRIFFSYLDIFKEH